MDIRAAANSASRVLASYLTYQAMRTVLAQLSESNPPVALWLHAFSGQSILQDGEAYLSALMAENQELALRIMVVREHLAHEVLDELPEMVRLRIAQQNTEHRRQQLEKLTQLSISDPETEVDSP
jgi:GTPase Era involved in 16S rRNA processing